MAETSVENLSINVKTNAGNAASQIKSLADSLEAIKKAASGRFNTNGLTRIANSIQELNSALEGTGQAAAALSDFATALGSLSAVGRVNISTNLDTAIPEIVTAVSTIAPDTVSHLTTLAYALAQFANLRGVTIPPSIARQIEAIGIAGASITPEAIENITALLDSLSSLGTVTIDTGINTALATLQGQMNNLTASAIRLRTNLNGIGRTSQSIRNIGKEAKESTKHTNKLWGSLKRIAFYRLIRTVIKEITQGFSEGLKAAYTFSSGLTSEGNRFAAALDRMKSATNAMKGQLGSSLAGLLAAIEPILTRIIDLVTRAADIISQFFSAFTGSTYLKAVKTQAKFADVTAKGAKAAKEWKNQLLGFDEINKLTEPSSGTGTSASNVLDGFDFEDAPISESIKRFADKIKTKFKEMLGSVDLEPLKKSFGTLWESLKKIANLENGPLSWVWEKILVPLGKWSIEEVAPRLVEALAAALDILGAVLGALEPLWDNVLEPFFEWCGKLVVTGLENLIDLLHDLTDLINGDISFAEFLNNLNVMKILLLSLGGAAVIGAITGLGGALGTLAKSTALHAAAIGAGILSIVGNIKKLTEAANAYEAAQKAHTNETETALNAFERVYKEKGKSVADQWAAIVYNIDTTSLSFEQSQKAITDKIEGYWEGVPQNMWEGFKQGAEKYFGTKGMAGADDLFVDAMHELVGGVEKALDINSPSGVFEDIGENTGKGFQIGFSNAWNDFISVVRVKLQNFRNLVQQNLSLGSVSVSYQSAVAGTTPRMFAGGGFPDEGELFIARERAPELVGSLNGHSAVANNDQIEAGIEEAAFRGFVRAMATTGGNQSGRDLVLNINGREFARATYKDYKAAARESGGSLINNFA